MLNEPVYKLLGGPARDKMFCYSTGNDVDWYQELGFKAFKLAPVMAMGKLLGNSTCFSLFEDKTEYPAV